MQLNKGGNAPLPGDRVDVTLTFDRRPKDADIDVSAYMLRSDGKVRGDADMVYFGQLKAPGVSLDLAASRFSISTGEIAADVDKVSICVVVDGEPASTLGAISMAIAGGPSFRLDVSDAPEAAIILADIYRRNGEWKVRAVGQGFTGGMAPLARSFGMDVAEDTADTADAAPAPAPAPAAAISSGPVSLKKVTLKKEGSVMHPLHNRLEQHRVVCTDALGCGSGKDGEPLCQIPDGLHGVGLGSSGAG